MRDDSGIARLMMLKEAIASHNIEHPDKPITISEYLLWEATEKRR
jgi:hypothetical protein